MTKEVKRFRRNIKARKEEKYQQAVSRNIHAALRKPNRAAGMAIEQLRHLVGVRRNDKQFDDRLLRLSDACKRAAASDEAELGKV